ncbi:beta-ketoacyl-ACP synthase III [Zavarzinella formosa]|uniref:beta-ketoacyl-ACP synthase III n=1 Tax=Zavarzinella formosa TaxID=360055 RepID=UPI000372DC8D|nr:beta-ketoacyl-ACP synthase III [Zavarzinella formosa]
MIGLHNSVIRSTGCSVPSRVVPNEWFTNYVDTSDEWIRSRTGIRERRFVGPGESSATLGVTAAKLALESSDLHPEDIDLIICATVTPENMCPQNAAVIHAALGCRPIPAFDLSAACTGFLYAMSIADQFLKTGAARHVLIVGSDVLSRTLDFTDRNSCILFGDGAGAAILSASPQRERGVHSVKIYADGGPRELIHVPGLVTPQPPADQKQHEHIRLNGREVFKFAVRRMIELTTDAILECRLAGRSIDLLIPHQVNQRIIDAALESTGFPSDRVMVNLEKYGNTSAASVPIALDEALKTGRAKPGDTLLLVAFGGGLTWGSAIVTL